MDSTRCHTEMIYRDLYRATRHSVGGVVQKGIAGIDLALWDIKAKALGVPVYELLGGPTRDKVRLYWTHFGTYRISHGDHLGIPPIQSLEGIAELARGVVIMLDVLWNGFTAAKKIADLAEAYEVSVCPHNDYSHLSTLISGHLCACVPNVCIMENEVEDVP